MHDNQCVQSGCHLSDAANLHAVDFIA